MKYQDLFSSENKKKSKLSSALVVIGTLRAKYRNLLHKNIFCGNQSEEFYYSFSYDNSNEY